MGLIAKLGKKVLTTMASVAARAVGQAGCARHSGSPANAANSAATSVARSRKLV